MHIFVETLSNLPQGPKVKRYGSGDISAPHKQG